MSHPAINPASKGSLIGHQGRCFDLKCFPVSGNLSTEHFLLSSSEDGTAKVWNPATRKCMYTFLHNKSSEVLRSAFIGSTDQSSIVCTAGSDGKSILWKYDVPSSSSSDPVCKHPPQKMATLTHRNEESQIYVCESHHAYNHLLLTAADNEVYLWDICREVPEPLNHWKFFLPDPSSNAHGVHFGGEGRNPNRECYVFDAKWHLTIPQVITSLLSDNSMKILDIRSEETRCNLFFPKEVYDEEMQKDCRLGHPTSINFSNVGGSFEHLCSVTFGSGHVGLLDLRKMELLSLVRIHSRPCYGSIFRPVSTPNELGILSWSSDSTICKWAYSVDISTAEASPQDAPLSSIEVIVDDNYQIPSFSPLVCCQASADTLYCGGEISNGETSNPHKKSTMSFLGVPIHILDLSNHI